MRASGAPTIEIAAAGSGYRLQSREYYATLPKAQTALESFAVNQAVRASGEPQEGPISLNETQEQAAKSWAADDRLWTTQETVAFNLRTFARLILAATSPSDAGARPLRDERWYDGVDATRSSGGWRQCRYCKAYIGVRDGEIPAVKHVAPCPVHALELAQRVALSDAGARQQIGEARADVVRMATTKVGDRCEHHTWPLDKLERVALRECPICWKECAEALQRELDTLKAATDPLAGLRAAKYLNPVCALDGCQWLRAALSDAGAAPQAAERPAFVPDEIMERNIARDLRHTPTCGEGSGGWVMAVRYLVHALAESRKLAGSIPEGETPQ